MRSVPSYKFIPLSYQIFSRLGNNKNDNDKNSGSSSNNNNNNNNNSNNVAVTQTSRNLLELPSFQHILQTLVQRLCTDHPHHTLPLLFALANESTYAHSFLLFIIELVQSIVYYKLYRFIILSFCHFIIFL